jgi:hypothetical protein
MKTNLTTAVIFGVGFVIGVAVGERVIAKARQIWGAR